MRIGGWLFIAVSVGVPGLGVFFVIALGPSLEFGVLAVAVAAMPAAIARSLFAKARGRELVGR